MKLNILSVFCEEEFQEYVEPEHPHITAADFPHSKWSNKAEQTRPFMTLAAGVKYHPSQTFRYIDQPPLAGRGLPASTWIQVTKGHLRDGVASATAPGTHWFVAFRVQN